MLEGKIDYAICIVRYDQDLSYLDFGVRKLSHWARLMISVITFAWVNLRAEGNTEEAKQSRPKAGQKGQNLAP